MATKHPWIVWTFLLVCAVAAVLYVGFGTWPQGSLVGERLWLVVLANAVIGIPLGIRFGTQEKEFWP